MKMTEQQIEDIIYNSPWLLDERFIIPKIPGSRGENGRQINIGKDKSRFIDLLFKDTRDDRPVIIELKKGKIIRENIAQTLEYRALVASLNDDTREIWLNEFKQNYFAPKMILIGNEADEDTIISANLAGIEIRTFKTEYDEEIGFDSIKELKTKLKEWNNFRNSGNRTLIERGDWILSIHARLSDIINEEYGEELTINRPVRLSQKKSYVDQIFPFVNIFLSYDDEVLIGLYEYWDVELPFDDKFIYCDFCFLMDSEDVEEFDDKIILNFKKQMEKAGFDLVNYSDYKTPIIKIPRSVLENESEFKKTIKLLIKKALLIYEKF
jgi:hypothetical protein